MHCSIYGVRFHIHLSWCDVGYSKYGRGGHVPAFVAGLATLERGLKQGNWTLPAKASEIMANPLRSSLTLLDDS
jgi:hypothetical protein